MKQFFYSAVIIFAAILFPDVVVAQIGADGTLAPNSGFVPCEGSGCNACHFVVMANTIIRWMMGIIAVLFAVVAAMAGWGLVTSAGNAGAVEDAKKKFVSTFIGFVIVLGAWLLIDTIMLALTGEESGSWANVECTPQTPTEFVSNPVDSSSSGTDSATGAGPGGYSGPVELAPAGSSCFPGPNGVYDGGPLQGGDDVCLSTSGVTGADYNLPDGSGLGYTAPTQYFGPDAISSNPQLTPDLRLCDVTNCSESQRTGDYVAIDPFMVAQLQNVYTDLGGLTVNSGYRSPTYNESVGGATHSRHQYGDAVDIAVTSSNTEARIIASCQERGATNWYTYSSGAHVHCDWRGAERN